MDESKNIRHPSGQQRPPERRLQGGQSPYMGQNMYGNGYPQRTNGNYHANMSQRQTIGGQTGQRQMPQGQRQTGQRQTTQKQYTTGQNRTSDMKRSGMQQRPPQNKRRKKKKKKSIIGSIFKFIFIVGIILCFAVGGAGLGMVMGIIEGTDAINVVDVVPESYTSFIYDSAGNEIDSLHGKENREYAKLETIPVNLRRAVIAIEDERFYQHSGIDMRGMGRALITNIKNKEFTQGASTLTQQLIKNAVFDDWVNDSPHLLDL